MFALKLAALRPPFLGDSFPSLKRSIILGRFPPLPRQYSEGLQRVVAIMLRVNSKERPTASQLLCSGEVINKIESNFAAIENQDSARSLLETIKIPQVLKKLNDVLPKPCYPEVENIAPALPYNPNEDVSRKQPSELKQQSSVEQKSNNNNMRPANPSSILQPCPPPTSNRNVPRNQYHHRIW